MYDCQDTGGGSTYALAYLTPLTPTCFLLKSGFIAAILKAFI